MFDIPAKILSSIIICFFIGKFIDESLNITPPIFTILFSFLGLIGGVYSCIKPLLK